MAVNSTEVSYAFGQMGSVLITGVSEVVSVGSDVSKRDNPTSMLEDAVFCAITFLEDTVFNSDGLVATDPKKFISSGPGGQTNISYNTSTTGGEVFPKGVTIYGRFTKIKLNSGKVIAYIGY
jgi:hypothetical protein